RTLGSGTDFWYGDRRCYLKQDMSSVNQISGLEFLQVILIKASAFRLSGRRHPYLVREQALNGRADQSVILSVRSQHANRSGTLPQQLAHRCNARVWPSGNFHCDAVDSDGHDRTGTLARVRGERTIW